MSRNLSLSYSPKHPRSVRGAGRRGWHVVKIDPEKRMASNTSWLGLLVWADKNMKGPYVSSFETNKFAFEKTEDASWFTMKWCV